MQSALKLEESCLRRLRRWVLFFILALVLSGLSALPVKWGANFLATLFPPGASAMGDWVDNLVVGINHADLHYQFLFYGYDWLAFAHILFGILFIGVYQNPVRNRWVIEFGMIACILIIPTALIAGHFRQIPIWWRMLDSMFGIIGLIPLAICNSLSWKLEKLRQHEEESLMPLKLSQSKS